MSGGQIVESLAIDIVSRSRDRGIADVNAQVTQLTQNVGGTGVQAFRLFGASSRGAGAGVKTVQSAVSQLALSLAGMQGPAGTAARVLGQFALGGGLATAIALGLGGATLAFRHLTAATREAKQEQEEFLKGSREEFERAFLTPVQQAERQLAHAQRVRDQVREELRLAQRGRAVATPGGLFFEVDPAAVEKATADLRAANRKVQVAAKEAGDATKAAGEAGQSATSTTIQQLVRVAELRGRDADSLRELQDLERQLTEQLRAKNLTLAEEIRLREDLKRIMGARIAAGDLGSLDAFLASAEFRGGVDEAAARGQELGRGANIPRETPGGVARELMAKKRAAEESDAQRALRGYVDALGGGTEELRAWAAAVRESGRTPLQTLHRTLNQLDQALKAGLLTQDEYDRAVADATAAYKKNEAAANRSAVRSDQLAIAAIQTTSSLVAMAAAGQASAGGFLGLAGGLISLINPVAGAVVGGLGTIVSGFESRREPAPVVIRDIDDRAAAKMRGSRTGPDRITIIDRFGNERDILARRQRLTALDAIDRDRGEEVPVAG